MSFNPETIIAAHHCAPSDLVLAPYTAFHLAPYLNDSLHAAAFFHCLVLPSDCLIMKAICRGSC